MVTGGGRGDLKKIKFSGNNFYCENTYLFLTYWHGCCGKA